MGFDYLKHYQIHEENSSTANGKQHIFTITVYIAEQKLKMKRTNEFDKLKSFANELCFSSELNSRTISCLYATATSQDTNNVYGSKEKLDLSNISFEVLNDIDSMDCDEDIKEKGT